MLQRIDRFLEMLYERRLVVPLIGAFFLLVLPILFKKDELILFLPGLLMIAALVAYRGVIALWAVGLFAMPLSLNLRQIVGGASVVVPSDLIAIGLLVMIVLKWRAVRPVLGRVLQHPLTIIVVLYLVWMLITAVTSSMPGVSIKFWLNRLWYMGGFFFLSMVIFRERGHLLQWLWIMAPALAFVVLYTITRHATYGFSFGASFHVMTPLYKDHTIYGASLALLGVAYLVLAVYQRRMTKPWLWAWLMAGLVLLGVFLSYTRGAWLGVLGALAVWLVVRYWRVMRFAVVGLLVAVAFGASLFFSGTYNFRVTTAEEERGFLEHFKTAFDLEENLSNKERINRWVAAINMTEERPLLGFGPGTYAFQYAPFQEARYRTWVSTNRGDVGTAHNEFLLASSEMGLPGAILTLLLYLASIFYAFRGYRQSRGWRSAGYLIALLGPLTFYAHAVVNNFMDQDKVAIPLYLSLAMIVALDMFPELDAEGPPPAAKRDLQGD
jgi:O-antigen ligase